MSYTKCRHCTTQIQLASWEPHDAPRPICQRCRELLAELGDTVVAPPARERQPGDDDERPRKPKRDCKWLFWAVKKRGRIQDARRIGIEHGFPRDMLRWSPTMVEVCIQELQQTRPH
jgi:hypothetical protein